MASLELDPLFLKALRLLHSKAKDSAEQLRQLLDDVLAQKQTTTLKESKLFIAPKMENDNGSKAYSKKSSPRNGSEIGGTSIKYIQEEVRKKEPEKRLLEKVKQEPPDYIHETKRPRMDSPQPFCYSPPSPGLPKGEDIIIKKGDDDTDSSDGNADADDFAMEMGLACVICKQIEVSHGNQLIECQECHSLYHQECHRPPATDHDVNDPRRVWYCAKCTKTMKKLASKTQKSSKSSSMALAKESASQSRGGKSESTPAALLPFKRTELKAPVSQSNNLTTTNKPIGLAGLAANLTGRAATTASTTTSGSVTRTGNSKAPSASSASKPFSSFMSLMTLSSTKNSNQTSSTSSLKTTNTNTFSAQSSSSATAAIVAKSSNSTTTTTSKSGLGLLISTTSTSNRGGSSGNNGNNSGMAAGGAKPASSSSLMSADKRLQIMKKKAAKMQEKRRLSTK